MLSYLKGLGSKKMRIFDVTPPSPMADRQGIAMVTIVNNVERYIDEWLDFHRAAGARYFFIYDNGCTDDTCGRIRRSVHSHVVTITPWRMQGKDPVTGRRISQQVSAYAHAITTFGQNFQRMAFIDIDEFLVPDLGLDLMAALTGYGDYSNISLPWHMFGHNGHSLAPEGWVTRNFTSRAPVPYALKSDLLRFKCVVDPCRISGVGVHSFETVDMRDQTANAAGFVAKNSQRKRPDFFTSSSLQLNHYYLLSKTELEQKLDRGPINFGNRKDYRNRVIQKIAEIEANPVEDHKAVAYFNQRSSGN